MIKESRNFTLCADTVQKLRRLSEKWKVSQAHALDIIIDEADRQDKDLRLVKERDAARRSI